MPIFDLYFKIFIIFINSKVIRDRPINKSKALYVGVSILDYDLFQVSSFICSHQMVIRGKYGLWHPCKSVLSCSKFIHLPSIYYRSKVEFFSHLLRYVNICKHEVYFLCKGHQSEGNISFVSYLLSM